MTGATGASTAGRFGLYRWDAGPRSGGADPHFHRTMSESFFVVSGRVELYDGKQWVDAGPGAIAERAAGRPYSDEEWTALCERHDNYFVEAM